LTFPALAIDGKKLRSMAVQTAMYFMLGTFIGFLFFYDVFNYYCEPFTASLPSWVLAVFLLFPGVVACYLYPDIIHVMLSAILLPVSGALFCLLLYISPAFSADIVGTFSDWLFDLARFILPDVILACVVTFSTGFVSLYVFDTE
jgi:hypothetical protein